MHILDFIMFFVTIAIVWYLLDLISDGDLTHELGSVVNFLIFCWVIIYIGLFWVGPYNWVDIFASIKVYITNFNLNFQL